MSFVSNGRHMTVKVQLTANNNSKITSFCHLRLAKTATRRRFASHWLKMFIYFPIWFTHRLLRNSDLNSCLQFYAAMRYCAVSNQRKRMPHWAQYIGGPSVCLSVRPHKL